MEGRKRGGGERSGGKEWKEIKGREKRRREGKKEGEEEGGREKEGRGQFSNVRNF